MKLRFITRQLVAMLVAIVLVASYGTVALAAGGNTAVIGKVYTFDKDGHYEFSTATESIASDKADTYGTFSVNGIFSDTTTKNGVTAFTVSEGTLSVMYSYTDALLNAGEDEWHLVDDKSKKLDSRTLGDNILKGVIIIQTSKDRVNWVDVGQALNVFGQNPVNTAAIYEAQDIQLINGCFYRVIVGYELARRTEQSSFAGIDTSSYEYKKVAEVYEFYACTPDAGATQANPNQTYNLGSVVRVDQFAGYAGAKEMEKDDPHYGITLGQFFVSGYTDKQSEPDGNMVFLKNVGDQVVLWFRLNQNIDAIGGNEKITVTPDSNGYDQYFQTTPTDFGCGTLIIRYTDYNNNATEPQIYTNYLEANATVGADTMVKLFEEGDYEVALDYEVTEDKIIDAEGHYRIFFKFSIRNGNCMVFPFDLGTGAELTNSSMTETGFRLDLARSRYLKINVKREMLADSADGLIEDTRFNGPARDGAEYRDEGIYTITATNQYTGAVTVKKIYVGTNNILRAYMTTGLSIPEITNLIAQGATITEDGTIQMPVPTEPVEPATEEPKVTEAPIVQPIVPEATEEPVSTDAEDKNVTSQEESRSNTPIVIISVIAAAVLVFGGAAISKKKKTAVKVPPVVVAVEDEAAAEEETSDTENILPDQEEGESKE